MHAFTDMGLLTTLVRGSTPPIELPGALASLEPVTLNGTKQWVLLRSQDPASPVVLFVHGGPGTSQLTLMRRGLAPLERHFTVVNWDQRLAGKSFSAGADRTRLHVDQYVDDLIELSRQLGRRFGQPRILLVGHSWGSAISMLALQRRPDLFWGYVGIGQASRMLESERLSYEWTLAQARCRGEPRAVTRLERLGPPPYARRSQFLTQRSLMSRYGGEVFGSDTGATGVVFRNVLLGSEYGLADRINFFRGIFRSLDALLPELYRIDLFAQVPEVAVPVVFCLGRHDHEVPSELSARYFDALVAPRKQLVWFERSGHMPNTEEPEKFCDVMVREVLPLAPPAMRRPRSGLA